jgi:hypothetical protein
MGMGVLSAKGYVSSGAFFRDYRLRTVPHGLSGGRVFTVAPALPFSATQHDEMDKA